MTALGGGVCLTSGSSLYSLKVKIRKTNKFLYVKREHNNEQ